MKDLSINNLGSRKIVFYFPFKIVSGGPFYLTQLAKSIAAKKEYTVLYIDFKNAPSKKLLEKSDVFFVEYNNEIKFYLYPSEGITLITPIYWAHRVPILNAASKIVFFNWHNLCVPSLRANLACTSMLLKEFLHIISMGDACFFCDKAHWLAQEKYGIHFKELYVPIVISNRPYELGCDIVDFSSINVTILGRVVIDKVFAIVDVIENISRLNFTKKIKINIIGDGDCIDKVKRLMLPNNIELHFWGTLTIAEIDDILVQKTDILFAMGTSVLEGAAIGIPSVVIPNDIKSFECDKYTYLYECKGYLLGWGPDQIEELGVPTHTMREIIDDVYTKGMKSEIGSKCRKYYRMNHLDNYDSIKSVLFNVKLDYRTFKESFNYLKRSMRNFLFDVIENKKNRKLVIWGAGEGGKKILKRFAKKSIKIDFIVDIKAGEIKSLDGIEVRHPKILSVDKHFVIVSLWTFVPAILDELESRGYKRENDYFYPSSY